MARGKEPDDDLPDACPGDHFFWHWAAQTAALPHARAVARPDIVGAMRRELDPVPTSTVSGIRVFPANSRTRGTRGRRYPGPSTVGETAGEGRQGISWERFARCSKLELFYRRTLKHSNPAMLCWRCFHEFSPATDCGPLLVSCLYMAVEAVGFLVNLPKLTAMQTGLAMD